MFKLRLLSKKMRKNRPKRERGSRPAAALHVDQASPPVIE
jgi:hypothetical protein